MSTANRRHLTRDKEIGRVIRLARHRRNPPLTCDALASLLGISRNTLNRWETGQTSIRASYIPDIARALALDICDFFVHCWVPEKPGREPTEAELSTMIGPP